MVNIETIRLIDILNKLAKKTANGYMEFSEVNEKNCMSARSVIVYDKSVEMPVRNEEACESYAIIEHFSVNEEHHDIVSYFKSKNTGFEVGVVIPYDDDIDPYVQISLWDGSLITICDGEWYFTD